jgi:O-antigen ligase
VKKNLTSINPEVIVFALLWAFIFCVPWEEQVVLPTHLPISHVVGGGAAAAGVLVAILRRRIRRLASIHYLAAAFVLWSVLSYGWSIAPELTTVRAGSYVQLFLMVWLIWEFAGTYEREMSLVAAYVLGTWVAALSTLYAFFTGSGTNIGLSEGRYTAAGQNENELGIILALGIAMGCYLLSSGKHPRILWLVSIPTFLIAILLSGSRGSLIASGVALLLVPSTLARFSMAARLTVGGVLLVAIALSAAALPEQTWTRVRSIPTELSQGTMSNRTDIWSAGLDAYRQHPWIGVGAGAFEAAAYEQLGVFYVAHNSYLSILVELGMTGIILFAALLLALFHAAFSLPNVSRFAWVVLLLTWCVAVFSVTWEYRKPTWFLVALLIAQSATLRGRRFPGALPMAKAGLRNRLRAA